MVIRTSIAKEPYIFVIFREGGGGGGGGGEEGMVRAHYPLIRTNV